MSLDDRLGAHQARRRKWTGAAGTANRALISPDPESRARAQVTFAFPASAREELRGDLPPTG